MMMTMMMMMMDDQDEDDDDDQDEDEDDDDDDEMIRMRMMMMMMAATILIIRIYDSNGFATISARPCCRENLDRWRRIATSSPWRSGAFGFHGWFPLHSDHHWS